MLELPITPIPSLRPRLRSLYLATDLLKIHDESDFNGGLTEGGIRFLWFVVRNAVVYYPALNKLTVEIPFAETKPIRRNIITLLRPTCGIDVALGVYHE